MQRRWIKSSWPHCPGQGIGETLSYILTATWTVLSDLVRLPATAGADVHRRRGFQQQPD